MYILYIGIYTYLCRKSYIRKTRLEKGHKLADKSEAVKKHITRICLFGRDIEKKNASTVCVCSIYTHIPIHFI